MSMKKSILIAAGSLAAVGIGYVIYKKQVPPRFTVRMFSPETMEASIEWGKSEWSLGPQTNMGPAPGWGWSADIKADQTNKRFNVAVSKNGKPYKTFTIENSGIIHI